MNMHYVNNLYFWRGLLCMRPLISRLTRTLSDLFDRVPLPIYVLLTYTARGTPTIMAAFTGSQTMSHPLEVLRSSKAATVPPPAWLHGAHRDQCTIVLYVASLSYIWTPLNEVLAGRLSSQKLLLGTMQAARHILIRYVLSHEGPSKHARVCAPHVKLEMTQ